MFLVNCCIYRHYATVQGGAVVRPNSTMTPHRTDTGSAATWFSEGECEYWSAYPEEKWKERKEKEKKKNLQI